MDIGRRASQPGGHSLDSGSARRGTGVGGGASTGIGSHRSSSSEAGRRLRAEEKRAGQAAAALHALRIARESRGPSEALPTPAAVTAMPAA